MIKGGDRRSYVGFSMGRRWYCSPYSLTKKDRNKVEIR